MANSFTQKFIYTELAKPSLGHTEPYNLFGVIMDATLPYQKQKNSGYGSAGKQNQLMCHLKIIDQSLNIRAA